MQQLGLAGYPLPCLCEFSKGGGESLRPGGQRHLYEVEHVDWGTVSFKEIVEMERRRRIERVDEVYCVGVSLVGELEDQTEATYFQWEAWATRRSYPASRRPGCCHDVGRTKCSSS